MFLECRHTYCFFYRIASINPLYTGYPWNGTLANSGDSDEMQHNYAFHLGLYWLLRLRRSSEKKMQYYLEIITCLRLNIYNELT